MARTHNVNVEIRAEISDFTKKLQEASGLTDKQAKKMANSFSKQMKRMEKSAQIDLNPKGLKDFEDAAGDVDSVVAALAGGLSEISPEFGAIIALGAESASVFEAVARSGSKFARVLGPLVLVIGLAAAAYEHFKGKAEESKEALEAQAEAAKTAEKAFHQMALTIEDVQYQNLVLSGIMDDLELKQIQQEKRIRQGFESEILLRNKNIASLKERERAEQLKFKTEVKSLEQANRVSAVIKDLESQRYAEAFALKEVNKTLETTISLNAENTEMIRQSKEEKERERAEIEKSRKAKEKAAAAAREQAEAERELTAAMREKAAAMAEVDADIEKTIKADQTLAALKSQLFSTADAMATLNPIEMLAKNQADALKRFDTDSLKVLTLAEGLGEDVKQLDFQITWERLAIQESYQEKKAALEKEALEKSRAEQMAYYQEVANLANQAFSEIATFQLEKRLKTLQQLRGIEATLGEQMNDAQKALLQARIENEKTAAMRAWKAQKASAAVQIGIDTATAIIKTMSQWGFPWGLIPAGLMTAMGGVALAKVLSEPPPQFHTGGMVSDVSTDEANIRVLRSEAILNPTAVSALGRDGVNRLNQGQGQQPQMVIVQYRNRVLDVTLQDVSRRPGPLRTALANRNKTGHSGR